ncbi:hypothetical protein HYALB_00006613 [Hymenoscyphus albidus]|uniref:Uncharacterized protein n=1 Tax=Hymenoscyphus albidus TaxID=595503 RepID=A0A9N9LNS2_9HELO|nr:hypothetical protein HYALB_00006613 [Hymenoscyphus albidus]
MSKVRQIDWIEALMISAAFVTGIMAFNFGGTLYTWNNGQIISLFVVSGACFITLFLQQYFKFMTTHALRVLPIHLFRVRDMALCFVCQVAVALIVPVPLYYLPIFFQLARGDSALRAGIKTLPLISTWVTSSAFRGRMMGKLGWYQPCYIVGSILNILAGVFLSRINIDTSNAVIYGFQILSGIGTGCYGQTGFAVAQQLVPPADIHRSISLMLIAQLSRTTLGLALAGAIFQNVSLSHIRAILPNLSTAQLSRIITDVGSIDEVEINESDRIRVLHSLATASADTYTLIYAAAGLFLICSLFFTNPPTSKTLVKMGSIW